MHSVIINNCTVIINNQCINKPYWQSSRNTVNQLLNPFWPMVFWCFRGGYQMGTLAWMGTSAAIFELFSTDNTSKQSFYLKVSEIYDYIFVIFFPFPFSFPTKIIYVYFCVSMPTYMCTFYTAPRWGPRLTTGEVLSFLFQNGFSGLD